MRSAIIVEDEKLAVDLMQRLISDHSDVIDLKDVAREGACAIEKINSIKPDLIFLDIQLPDMTGFDILQQLDYQPLVIFTTAYEQYAIKAFDAFCVDYLVKPITRDRFQKAIEKLSRIDEPQPIDLEKLSVALDELKSKKKISSIPVTIADRIILIECLDITHLKGEDKYVRLFTKSGKSYLSNRTLSVLETTLPDNFTRIHRSCIVNRDHILDIRKHFKGKLLLKMDDLEQSSVTTGGRYTDSVKAILGI